MNNHPDPLLCVAEVAAMLGISSDGVRRRIASGELRAVKLGDSNSALRVRRSALDEYVDAHQVLPR
jgi:excisionase family DNA binding protein